jgi:plasmid maintenance system antidote protein VapI
MARKRNQPVHLKNTNACHNTKEIAFDVLTNMLKKSMTQVELSSLTGIPKRQIFKIVRGEEELTTEIIQKLEKALCITLNIK